LVALSFLLGDCLNFLFLYGAFSVDYTFMAAGFFNAEYWVFLTISANWPYIGYWD